jgi:aminoglycoside phosphotransferase (APT) family kinase protein
MTTAASMSHYVYIGADVVVKLVDAGGHPRLNREIGLAPHLPSRLGAPLLAGGRHRHQAYDVRYACFARVPGASPGVDLPGIDAATARLLAEDAVRLLSSLHAWIPTDDAERTLRDGLDQGGGFTGQDALVSDVKRLAAADRHAAVPRHLIDGLVAIAERAPLRARVDVPVHADSDWGNWLATGSSVTALLDFERARFGAPADDWFLLAVTSGPHRDMVLDVIAGATGTSPEALRADCEVRDAAFIAADIRDALEQPEPPAWMGRRLAQLEALIAGQRWPRGAR